MLTLCSQPAMSTAADKKPSKKPYDRPANGKGKDKKDEDACKVRRPQNSWILYRKDKFEQLRREAEAENKPRPIAADASKIISEAWKNESQEVKKYYNELAEKEKARHAEEHPDYKFKPKSKAQKLQEKEEKDLAKKRKGDGLRNEREAKLAARSTRGVGSDTMHPSLPAGIPLFYPPFAMAPPPLPGQAPGAGSSIAAPIHWFPFPYPAYLPTPTIPPAAKGPKTSTTAAEANSPEAGSGSAHQIPGETKAAKVVAKGKKRRSIESNSTSSSQSASSAGTSAPADPRATVASSPRVVTPPTIDQEVSAPKSTPIQKSGSSSRHSATVSIHCHGCLNFRLTSMQEITPPSQSPRSPSVKSKVKPQASSQPAPASTSPLSFDRNLLGMLLVGPSIRPSPSSAQSSPLCPTSNPPNPFVDPKALSLATSSGASTFEPASLRPPHHRPQPQPSPTPRPGADPVLESLLPFQDIITSYLCETIDLPFPASQEAFDLAGFDELNFTPGTGQFDLREMFDWENVLGDGELKKWGGGWEGIDDACATGLDLGSSEFELGEGLGGDDGHGFRLGLDDAGIDLDVGPSVELDNVVNVAARVGVPAVLPTPRRLATRQTVAGSSSGSSGPVDSSGSGSGSDGLSFPDPPTFPIANYTDYAQHLQALQSQVEAQSVWEVPIEESPLSLSDYVDYTMCRTPSVAGPSRGGSLGPSRPLSRAASASASGTGRGRSLSRSSVPPGTTSSGGRSVGSTRGRSLTKSTGGGSSRATSQISRADSHDSVGRRTRNMRTNSFVGIPTGSTTSRVSSGGSGIGLDLSEMQVDPPPPTLPPPSAIIGVGSMTDTADTGMGAVPSTSPQPVSPQMFRNVETMDAQMLAALGGMLPGSFTTQFAHVQPSQLDLIESLSSPTIPPSMPPSSKSQQQVTHIQSMPPPGIPTVSSEDLAGIAGQGAIAWDPSQPPPAGYLLVAVPIPNSINLATTSSNLTPGTALHATGTIRSSHLSSTSGTELQNSIVQE